LSCLLVGF